MTARPIVVGATRGDYESFLADPPAPDIAHLTGVAWVLDPDRTQLLLVRHRLLGWSCPGGHLEPGEDPAAAAARELREETGIVAVPIGDAVAVATSIGCSRTPSARHWNVGFRFVVASSTSLSPEPAQPARWFSLTELPADRAPDVDAVVARLVELPSEG